MYSHRSFSYLRLVLCKWVLQRKRIPYFICSLSNVPSPRATVNRGELNVTLSISKSIIARFNLVTVLSLGHSITARFDFDCTRPMSPFTIPGAAGNAGSVPTTPVRALPTAPAPVRSHSLVASPLLAPPQPGAGRRRPRTVSVSHVGKSTMIQTSSRTIYTAGRPPWYDSEGTIKDAFIIGICGGSASGKEDSGTVKVIRPSW